MPCGLEFDSRSPPWSSPRSRSRAIGIHALWWRAADANSRLLLATINAQIVAAVEKEIESLAADARAAHASIRTLFVQNVLDTREADKREFVFLSQLQSRPSFSWIAFGWPDGSFFAAHKLGDDQLEMTEIENVDGVPTRRIDRYRVLAGDIEFEQRSFEPTDYLVTDQLWYRGGQRAGRAALVQRRDASERLAAGDRLCGSDRRLSAAAGRAGDHHRIRTAVALPRAALGRQDRHGVHPRTCTA